MACTGKQPGEEVQRNLASKVVHQLCSQLRNTGRNITMHNFFTSAPLAEELLSKGLILVGRLCQNNHDIPVLIKPNKERELHSAEFGFNGNVMRVSYVLKK